MEDNKKEDEKVAVRHTINAEETFTLAKDVFDLRCLIKNIYANRAVISRRLNIFTLSVSLVFTLLYVAYIIFTGLMTKLSMQAEIAVYCLLGAYVLLFAVLLTVGLCGGGKAKNVKKVKKAMSVFRFTVRVLSLAIAIVALVGAAGGGADNKYIALNITLIVLSVICMIIQAIPLLFGGLGKLARWLLSPVKAKYGFSAVALEWYELAVTDAGGSKAVKRVSEKYYDDIGMCLDNCIIPAIGKKKIASIKSATVLNVVERVSAEDKSLAEGIFKSIFAYAEECGYVTFNPCKDLNFEGSIEEEEKPRKGVKGRLAGLGKKVGMSVLNKYINKTTTKETTIEKSGENVKKN